MLKRILENLDGVEDSLKKLYVEKDGKFYLEFDGQGDIDNAEKKRKIEIEHRKKAEAKLTDLQSQFESVQSKLQAIEEANENNNYEGNKKKGDIDALENSWKQKLETQKSDFENQISALNGSLSGLLVDNNAQKLASELAIEGSSEALIPHITRRLGVDVREGKHVPVVLDAEGKPSALTLDELKAEIGSNAAFAPLISGSKANGGGASNSGGGASGKKFSELSEQERTALYNKSPEDYRAARDAQ